jgi:hypothetical protein
MDVWLWIAIAAVAGVVVPAVVWWSSGRARPQRPREDGLMTPEEHARLDLDTIDTSLNRHGLWGGSQ